MSSDNLHGYPSIVFVGAHMEAEAPFRRLLACRERVLGLVTLDGWSMTRMSGAIDLTPFAYEAGIPVLHVRQINLPDAVAWVRDKAPDLLLVVGWTQLVSPELLRVPKLASLGFHASLLPKYRGRAPVNWAIINGETLTGNTMITLEPTADTGDVVAQRVISIRDEDTCKTIYEKVGQTEVEMLDEVLPLIRTGVLPRTKQDDTLATVMPKRRPEDGCIDWARSSRQVYNFVRALTDPYPGAFSFLNGEKIWLWEVRNDCRPWSACTTPPGVALIDSEGRPCVATSDGWIQIVTAQRTNGPKVSGQDAAKTFIPAGSIFHRV